MCMYLKGKFRRIHKKQSIGRNCVCEWVDGGIGALSLYFIFF